MVQWTETDTNKQTSSNLVIIVGKKKENYQSLSKDVSSISFSFNMALEFNNQNHSVPSFLPVDVTHRFYTIIMSASQRLFVGGYKYPQCERPTPKQRVFTVYYLYNRRRSSFQMTSIRSENST